MEFYGELAALFTAFCWAFTSLFFSEAGKRIGSYKVNKIRLLLAAIIYTIILLITKGHLIPDTFIWEHLFWLGLSGFVGFVIGDGAGFKAFVMIGVRLTMIIYASAPVMAVVIAWLFLGETISVIDIIGILVTVGGIVWVILERPGQNNHVVMKDHPDYGSYALGIFYSIIFSLGQAVGLILSKHAMVNLSQPIEAMEASFLRILSGMVIIWTYSLIRQNFMPTVKALKDTRALFYLVGGALFGPFLGVWMSLIAVKLIAAGIAATLNSTVPIWLLPLTRYLQKEKLSWQVIVGTLVTVGGIAILMLQ